ncbi:hypothetical protein N2152v2_001985 [Parachlorella kessleri]
MTTALAAQLQQLAAITGNAGGKRPRGKPSLLHTYQEASDLGIDAIYAVGLQGFEQLCRLDARFQPFGRTLFSQASLGYMREQQTAEVNAKLDALVLAFCKLLSGYFLLQPSFKALEYLIRRYKVNEHNADALMHAALPYHATNEFVRLVQVLRLGTGGSSRLWDFLAPMQQSGASMPREVLVQRCIHDRALLRFVCDMAQQLASPRQAGRVAMSFYAVVLCEFLAAVKTVDEPLLAMLLPYLLKGLGPDVIDDYRAATLMILTQLASKATLSSQLVSALVDDLCQGPAVRESLPQALLVLAHLAATQPHLSLLPRGAVQQLAKVGSVAAELAALANRGVKLRPLLVLLLKAAALLAVGSAECGALLEQIITLVPLGSAAGPLARSLLQQAAEEPQPEGPSATLLRLLRALELRWPAELDAAVNAALDPASAEGTDANSLGEAGRQRLFTVLELAFAGTARLPVLEAGTTLALAVDAPSAAVREMALQKLAALSLEDAGNDELAAFVRTSVLRRVQDDSPAVALAALRVGARARAPPGPLFDALSGCLCKALQQVLHPSGKKAARKAARELLKESLRQLAGPFAAGNSSYRDQVALLVLEALPAAAASLKVAPAVLDSAAALGTPLLVGLANVELPAAVPDDAAANKTPSKQKGKGAKPGLEQVAEAAAANPAVTFTRNVVAELAKHVAAQPEAQEALLRLLRLGLGQLREGHMEGRQGAALLLAVANAALRAEGGAGMAGDLLQLLLASIPPRSTADQHPPAMLVEGLLADESLAHLAGGTLSLHAMHAALLLSALEVVPADWLAQAGTEGVAGLFISLARQQQSMEGEGRQLTVLVRRAAEVLPVSELLSGIFALPPEVAPGVEVQVAALREFAASLASLHRPTDGAAGKPPSRGRSRPATVAAPAAAAATAAPRDRPLAALLRLLSALAHPQRAVRSAALEAVRALGDHLDAVWQGGGLEQLGLAESPAGDRRQEEQKAAPTREQLLAVLSALVAQRAAIEADAEVIESLLSRAVASVTAGVASPAPAGTRKGRGSATTAKKKAPAQEGTAAAAAAGAVGGSGALALQLASVDAAALQDLLLGLLPAQRGPAGLHAANFALHCLADTAPPVLLLSAAWQLMQSFAADGMDQGGVLAHQQQEQLAAEVMALFSPAAVSHLLAQDAQRGEQVLRALLGALSLPAQQDAGGTTQGAAGSAVVRLAALRALGPDLYAVLPEGAQQGGLVALLRCVSHDPSEDCRAAARASLAATPLGPAALAPLLDVTSKDPLAAPAADAGRTPAAKKRRGRAAALTAGEELAAAAGAAEPGPANIDAAKLDLCVAALELLQWQDNIERPLELVAPIQATLGALLSWQGAGGGAAGGYAAQLALAALLGLAKRAQQAQQAMEQFDLGLAVRAAQAAPSGALRNAALSLVGVLAAAAPQQALGHVLQVVGVVGLSAAMQAGAHSHKIAAQVLGAVVPAWVAGGGSIEEVVGEVVAAAPRIPSHRRLAVFIALREGLPTVEGLSAILAALLRRALGSGADGGEEATDEEDAAEAADASWAADLASAIMSKAPQAEQAAALAALLQHSMRSADHRPTEPLPLLATAFATQQLQAQAQASKARGPGGATLIITSPSSVLPLGPDATSQQAAELAAGYEALMRAALVQLQQAGELADAAARRSQAEKRKGGRGGSVGVEAAKLLERSKAATEGTYQLLQALQHVMQPAAYVSLLAALVSSQLDKVRRRALALVAAAVKSAEEHEPGRGPAGAAGVGDDGGAGAGSLQQAALASVPPAVQLLQPDKLGPGHQPVTAITKQTALAALGTLAAAYGAFAPQPFLAALPAVLAAAQDARSAVRSSALACIAAIVRALGPRLVPALPAVVRGVLAAAQAATAAVSAAAGSGTLGQLAAAARHTEPAGELESDEEEAAAAVEASSAKTGVPKEAPALELAACLAAILALVESLGAFLAPHLPALLGVLLAPGVLRCHAARCAEAAAAVRARLAGGVPPRLLLGPLLGHLEPAVEAGAPAVCAVLGMLSTTIGAMDAAATAAHHEVVFGALLRALDLRRRRPASLAPPAQLSAALDEVEGASVAAFVALTLKLSESQFKPLFLRLLDWAGSAPAPQGAGGHAARGVALAAVVNALAERLRSVFVPYFRHLLDLFLGYLADGSAAAPATKKQKKKKKQRTEAAGEADTTADPVQAEDGWRLRFQVVRALHRCFLYDTVKFLDEPRFERVLPPLVAQLALAPPPAAAAALEAVAGRDPGPEAGMDLGEAAPELDVMGRALVGCLAQLGVTAGSDALWKRLNHEVLMSSRSLEPRTRLLALEAAAQLAARLREEYLVLLPETLPFLAELLEDAEGAVEARAAAVLRWLEELSGESLEEYLKA